MANERESLRRKPKLTPKQRVRKKYPHAWAHSWKDVWSIYDGTSHSEPPFRGQEILAEARSVTAAWKLAAMRISL